jgi:hypothetical protein
MTQFMVCLFFLIFLAGCGQPETKVKSNEGIFPTTYTNTPLFLKVQNTTCRTNSFRGFETKFNLHLFMKGKKENQTHDFSPMLQELFLRDGLVISDSLTGEKIEIMDNNKSYLRVSPTSIKICPGENEYAPDTVESAALNTTYFINKSNLRFTSIVTDVTVLPITLNISPSIMRSTLEKSLSGETTKTSTFMTDNAFYMPARKSVTFLPHSLDMRKLGMKTSYWEIPFVASHEYGHHLFEMIYKDTQALGPDMLDCFGHSHSRNDKRLNKMLGQRKVRIDDVLNSYNEGFADLMAWYTLDPKERNFKGVKCLEVSRDVSSPRFFNGKLKAFSKEALQSFFSNYSDNSLRSCEEHRYQDTHILGAIFAHNADLFLSELTSSDDEKLAAVVAWAKKLKAERKKYLLASAEKFLEETVKLFMKMGLERFARGYDAEICTKIYRIYPDLNIKECSVKKDL